MQGEACKGEIRGSALKMGVTSGRFWSRWADEHILLLAVISWGLLFLADVEAWTYHYGDKSDLTWEEARIFCQTWFTDLVAIQNQEEIAYLNAVVPYYTKYYWIGIRKINNTWTWVGTNKILTKEAENWAYREPNNKRDNQDCVEIYIKRDREAGKWNDEPCIKKKRALCYQASCYPSSCSEQGECVETIGNYTCQCYPGFFGPECEYVRQCQEIESPRKGTMDCVNPIGDFAYSSTCSFSCDPGFQLIGANNLQCSASGQWSSHVPFCQAVQCKPLQFPTHGNSTCFHIHGEFQYQSNCTFHCNEGFLLLGEEMIRCTAQGEWTSAIPVCQAIECPKLNSPKNGELKCSHLYGDFMYSSMCTFSCNKGFVRIGMEQVQCTALGTWTEKPPLCEAIQCHSLQRPEKSRMDCSHPLGIFAFQSTCAFACEPGFALTGTKATHCLATGNWSAPIPICQAIQCPALEMPDNGKGNCSHPYGQFAYNSSCIFSCNSGFQLIGAQKLKCMDEGKWTGDVPICEASKCPVLHAPANGQLNCSHPHGHFAYNSTCAFSCNTGFVQVGLEVLNCMDLGEWTGSVPVCEVKRCPLLRDIENMRMNCSNPLGFFSYRSSCRFHCAEGYILNGTSTVQCQPNGQWSAEMPFCKESVAPFFKQVLLYTGGAAASIVALALSGGLIALVIKHLSRRGERKKLLSHTSDLGVPGVFSNAAFDSGL